MAIIKRKSLVVACTSGVIISAVLILTLAGYSVYTELKGEEFKRSYQELFQKVNAKVYSKHIDVSRLDAKTEDSGALRGKPVVEGIIKNNGTRNIVNLAVKVNFLDKDGAIIYEIVFHPQEPSLGSAGLTQVAIPYLYNPARMPIKPGDSLPFKKILNDCPQEILGELDKNKGFGKIPGKWSGKFSSEIVALEFQ